ncbi:hypothetical protein [Streptomyces sp. NBC_01506]|uniref:hypothetical protein n=1 Tax=Streptomyces sp. NBC_01506 TaxID=2903887 RepID=UPI0038662A96
MSRTVLRSTFGSMALTGVLVMAAGISAHTENAHSRALEVHTQPADPDSNPDDHGWQ